RPFDVLRLAERLLDREPETTELAHLRSPELGHADARRRDLDLATPFRVHDRFDGLRVHVAPHVANPTEPARHDVPIGHDTPGHDALALAPRGLDHHLAPRTGGRVHAEQHARATTRDLALDDH